MTDSLDEIIDRLADALRTHARVASGGGEPIEVIRAGDAVAQAARDYGDWLMDDNGGWGNPMGNIYADDEDDEEEEELDEADTPDSGDRRIVSVRAMYDYEVPDESLLIAAAQRLRDQVDPEGRPVGHVGEAIYSLIHGKGMTIPALEIPELIGLNGFTLVHQTTDPLESEDLAYDMGVNSNLVPNDNDSLIYSFGDHRSY